jgi:endonuclease-3 related protein
MSTPHVLPRPLSGKTAPSRRSLRHKLPKFDRSTLPVLREYFDVLHRAHGDQNWWPARCRFEVIIGAILTQNTSWTNVERAIVALRREKLLSPRALEEVSEGKLAELIRSSGYYRQKARKLKAFVGFLRTNYQGSLDRMFRVQTNVLREQLLAVYGIGPETADSILLYAGAHPVFVVDAYTRRMLQRHGLANEWDTYEEIRGLFERSLPADPELFNEYHALIVHTGKHFCRTKEPLCSACPLRGFLPAIILPVSPTEEAR